MKGHCPEQQASGGGSIPLDSVVSSQILAQIASHLRPFVGKIEQKLGHVYPCIAPPRVGELTLDERRMWKIAIPKDCVGEITIAEFCTPEVAINESRVGEIDAAEFTMLHMGPYDRRVADVPVFYSTLLSSEPLDFGSSLLESIPVHSVQTTLEEVTIMSEELRGSNQQMVQSLPDPETTYSSERVKFVQKSENPPSEGWGRCRRNEVRLQESSRSMPVQNYGLTDHRVAEMWHGRTRFALLLKVCYRQRRWHLVLSFCNFQGTYCCPAVSLCRFCLNNGGNGCDGRQGCAVGRRRGLRAALISCLACLGRCEIFPLRRDVLPEAVDRPTPTNGCEFLAYPSKKNLAD